MTEQVIYHEELQKAVAERLPDCDVYWEPQVTPRDICLGTLTACRKDNPGCKASMNFDIQRDYYCMRSEIQQDIEECADGFMTHSSPSLL